MKIIEFSSSIAEEGIDTETVRIPLKVHIQAFVVSEDTLDIPVDVVGKMLEEEQVLQEKLEGQKKEEEELQLKDNLRKEGNHNQVVIHIQVDCILLQLSIDLDTVLPEMMEELQVQDKDSLSEVLEEDLLLQEEVDTIVESGLFEEQEEHSLEEELGLCMKLVQDTVHIVAVVVVHTVLLDILVVAVVVVVEEEQAVD